MIRLAVPSIDDNDIRAVHEVLETGFLVQGQKVAAFEEAVAKLVGTQFAVAVSNCTSALHLSLLALGVRPGDIVLVTAYSWPATANVIELCGAQPVFVDIKSDTFNMDPECLAERLGRLINNAETKQRVKAILPVHTFGQMADMPAILGIANRYHLPVIEDAACALGASWQGKQAGTWGVMGCFSFHPRKAITTGEGGMITTNDPALVRKMRALRNHGQDFEASTIDFIMPGFNYRMTEFQAAFGLSQLGKFERIVSARHRVAAYYDKLIAGTFIQSPFVPTRSSPVYQSYVVLLPEGAAHYRSEIIKKLKQDGIETQIGTWHIPLASFYRSRYGYRVGDFPATDAVFKRALALPIYESITVEQQQQIASALLAQVGK